MSRQYNIHNNKRQNRAVKPRHPNFGKCFVSLRDQLDGMRCGYLLLQFNLYYMHRVLIITVHNTQKKTNVLPSLN